MKRSKRMVQRCSDIAAAQTVDEFRQQVAAFGHELGFGYFSATVVLEHSRKVTEFLQIHNTPSGYLSAFEDVLSAKWDPVSQHCKRFSTRILWSQDTYVSEGVGDLWEHQAKFGYKAGFGMACHMPLGRHFMFGFDSYRANPKGKALEYVQMEYHAVFNSAQEAAFRLLAPEACPARCGQPLTPFEIEVLRWALEGLSPMQTGRAMNFREDRIQRHIQDAVLKLDCKTKHEAVLKAARLRLLI